MSIAMLLDMAAEAAPDRLAVGPGSAALTFGDLSTRARSVAARLRRDGVERLGLIDLNSEAVPLALYGAAMAGVPFAPVNYRLPDEQLRSIVARLAPALVVAGAGTADRLGAIEGIELLSRDAFVAESACPSTDVELPSVDANDIAVLLFTSGTTGEPKAAVLRHRHLTSYVFASVEFLGAGEADAQIVSVPSYHIAGISSVLSSTFSGRRIVYLPAFEPDAWVKSVVDEGATHAMVVPTMLERVLDVMASTGESLPTLRHLSYGGGRMPVDLIRRALHALPHTDFVNAYGLTETSSTVAILGPAEHRAALASHDPRVQARLGSVGRPLPSVELQVRGATGGPLPPGEHGEVFIRGEQIAGEYLERNELTDEGWLATNDAGYLDEEGYLFLDGRLDDVIVRGAENLSPGEIEDTLIEHAAVVDAAVVGVPDSEWGEAVAAVVVLAEGVVVTADELRTWVRTRLRSTKAPTHIHFRATLPYNETGKLLRRVLRAELSAG